MQDSIEDIQRHLRNIDRLTHYENGAPLWEIWSEIQSRVGDIQKALTQLPQPVAPAQSGGVDEAKMFFEAWFKKFQAEKHLYGTTHKELLYTGFMVAVSHLTTMQSAPVQSGGVDLVTIRDVIAKADNEWENGEADDVDYNGDIIQDIYTYEAKAVLAHLATTQIAIQSGGAERISELEIKNIIQGMLARFVDLDVGIAIKEYVLAHLTTTQSAPSAGDVPFSEEARKAAFIRIYDDNDNDYDIFKDGWDAALLTSRMEGK